MLDLGIDPVALPMVLAGHYVGVGAVSISVTNLTIIVAMVVAFVLALLLPFPKNHDDGNER